MPPIKIVETIQPVRLIEPQPNVFIWDFGQHLTGWAKLRVCGPRGTAVTLRSAGWLNEDQTLDRKHYLAVVPAEQTDQYIMKGGGVEMWQPRFAHHGFRDVEVTGISARPQLDDLQGQFVHSDVAVIGNFRCSHPLLNQIHRNVCWTFLAAYQGGPQDAQTVTNGICGWAIPDLSPKTFSSTTISPAC